MRTRVLFVLSLIRACSAISFTHAVSEEAPLRWRLQPEAASAVGLDGAVASHGAVVRGIADLIRDVVVRELPRERGAAKNRQELALAKSQGQADLFPGDALLPAPGALPGKHPAAEESHLQIVILVLVPFLLFVSFWACWMGHRALLLQEEREKEDAAGECGSSPAGCPIDEGTPPPEVDRRHEFALYGFKIGVFIFVSVPFWCLVLLLSGAGVLCALEGWELIEGIDLEGQSLTGGPYYTRVYPVKEVSLVAAVFFTSLQITLLGSAVSYLDSSALDPLIRVLGLNSAETVYEAMCKFALVMAVFSAAVMASSAAFAVVLRLADPNYWTYSQAFGVILSMMLNGGITLTQKEPDDVPAKVGLVIIGSWGIGLTSVVIHCMGAPFTKPLLRRLSLDADGARTVREAVGRTTWLVFCVLPLAYVISMYAFAVPMMICEGWNFVDSLFFASSAVSNGHVALQTPTPGTLGGRVLTVLASIFGSHLIALGCQTCSRVIRPLQDSAARVCYGSRADLGGARRFILESLFVLPAGILLLCIPLGILLRLFGGFSYESTFSQCYWYVAMVVMGGGMELTDYEPSTVRGRFLVSIFASFYVHVVAAYVNLIEGAEVRRFFHIAMCGLELADTQQSGAAARRRSAEGQPREPAVAAGAADSPVPSSQQSPAPGRHL